jgi:hypothetical protein
MMILYHTHYDYKSDHKIISMKVLKDIVVKADENGY